MGAFPLVLECTPGPSPGTVMVKDGTIQPVPSGWELVPPGDPALTRRLKSAGAYWLVSEKRGRKIFSRGLYAPLETILAIQKELEGERADPSFARKKEAARVRREKLQTNYQADFERAVLDFLAFHSRFESLAGKLARFVTAHATPVGSGTVARTKMIPLEKRAEAAVIAWMRHQTTAYDQMVIPRIKGKRREIRRMLATRSREILGAYRRGDSISVGCPLGKTLEKLQ